MDLLYNLRVLARGQVRESWGSIMRLFDCGQAPDNSSIAASFGLPFVTRRAAMTESSSNPISTSPATTAGGIERGALEAAAPAAKIKKSLKVKNTKL